MLVCNISLRPRRGAIAAGIVETTAALDDLGSGSGQVVFATLVDDPASVGETVDAYLGEIMLEAATAADSQDASIPAVYVGSIDEAATASDSPSWSAVVLTAFSTSTNATLTNSNLTATHTNTSGASGARSVDYKSTGKFYFEITIGATHGSLDGVGILSSGRTYSDANNGYDFEVFMAFSSGAIFSGGSPIGAAIGATTAGDVVCAAIDLTNSKGWFRKNSGNWNNNAGADPATNALGGSISAGSYAPYVAFGGSGTAVNDAFTANFGQSAFAFSAPSGFGNWNV